MAGKLIADDHDGQQEWKYEWTSANLDKHRLVDVYRMKLLKALTFNDESGYYATTFGHDRCGDMNLKWRLINNLTYDCGHQPQTVEQIVFEYPKTRVDGDLQ